MVILESIYRLVLDILQGISLVFSLLHSSCAPQLMLAVLQLLQACDLQHSQWGGGLPAAGCYTFLQLVEMCENLWWHRVDLGP